MKTVVIVLIVILTVAPGVLAEETFNPYTGQWEDTPDAGVVVQDSHGDRTLYEDPDMESPYDPYEDQVDEQRPLDETWSDAPEDQWDKPQPEDDLADSDDDGWNQPPPEEGYSDGYGDQWSHEQPQEESWSYSPGSRERRGPPPPLRRPSGRQ